MISGMEIMANDIDEVFLFHVPRHLLVQLSHMHWHLLECLHLVYVLLEFLGHRSPLHRISGVKGI